MPVRPRATGGPRDDGRQSNFPNMAGQVAAAANAPPVQTQVELTYYSAATMVLQYEQAIAQMKAANLPQALIDQAETMLASLRTTAAAFPVPTRNPFQQP